MRLGKLSSRRRTRDAEGVFVIDGPTLLVSALAAGVTVTEVFVDVERADDTLLASIDAAEVAGAEVFAVPGDVLRRATDPVHPQPVAALARRPEVPGDVFTGATGVLALLGVADPGNAGTMIRAAVAAGFDAVCVTPGTVEIFGPKALRASAGTAFSVPVVELESPHAGFEAWRAAGMTTVATVVDAPVAHDAVDLTGPVVVLVGNEAHGLDPAITARADLAVTIPMPGPAESLNAAMAATLLCFEIVRQRRNASSPPAAAADPTAIEVPAP